MIDIEKQIKYWVETGEDDLSTAQYLYDGKRLIQCLFFCHLSIEKIIKAHVTKSTEEIPEKTNNLNKLLLKTSLSLDETQKELLGLLMIYQLEGRYPEYYPQKPSVETCFSYLKRTKELFEWLKMML
jgi:HEPN domain-containing protein